MLYNKLPVKLAIGLAMSLALAMLAGCAGGQAQARYPAPEISQTEKNALEASNPPSAPTQSEAPKSGHDMIDDEIREAVISAAKGGVDSTLAPGSESPVVSGRDAPDTAAPANDGKPAYVYHEPETMEAIAKMGGVVADVEKSNVADTVDIEGENPYAIVWDYGRSWDKYVDRVDWDLLFDIDFYSEQFPMLAELYHHDETLLLQHFQTVGVHEGRQGIESFNVGAYMDHCGKSVKDAFGDYYECYYLYWALNQDTEASVDTDGEGYLVQYATKMTYSQAAQLEEINQWREDAGVAPIVFDSELAALADYRSWVNVETGSKAHDWMKQNLDEMYRLMDLFDADGVSENTIDSKIGLGPKLYDWNENYYGSASHKAAMLDPDNEYIGLSSAHYKTGENMTGHINHFQVFAGTLDTAVHPE